MYSVYFRSGQICSYNVNISYLAFVMYGLFHSNCVKFFNSCYLTVLYYQAIISIFFKNLHLQA